MCVFIYIYFFLIKIINLQGGQNQTVQKYVIESENSLILIMTFENCILYCLNDNPEPLRNISIIPLCNKADNYTTNI